MTLVRRHTRAVWLVLCVAALGVALALLTSWLAPAQGFMGICDPNTTLPLPAEPGKQTGVALSATTTQVDGWTVVSTPMSPMDAYGGAGYDWHTFAEGCLDFSVGTTVGNILFTIFVSVPATILGAITQFAFSTTIVNALLPFVGGGVNDLSNSVFRNWAPMVIAFVLIGVLITIARGRGQKGLGDLGWMVTVIGIVGLLASPVGPQFLQKVNDTTRQITSCVMFAATAGCSAGDNANTMTVGMVDTLSFDTWATGALGDIAKDPMPASVSYGERKDPYMVNEDRQVTVPLDVIPAQNPGAPTWAETLRWTQTYTHNEMHAMKNNAALRCSVSSSQNIANLSENNPIADSDSTSELCGFKWLLRGAMYSHLLDHNPDAYSSAIGKGMERVMVSFISMFTVFPIAILLLVLGFMVLIYQMEMLLLFITSPVVALLAMKSKSTGRRWFDMALAVLVKWISAGLVLGLVMMLVDWSGELMNELVAISGGMAMNLVVASRGILVLLFVIVGLLMFFKIQSMLLSATGLEGTSNNGTKGKAFMGALGLGAVGAVAGAAGAGAGVAGGVRAKAAAMGAARGAMGRSRTGTQYALERAHNAGKKIGSQAQDAASQEPTGTAEAGEKDRTIRPEIPPLPQEVEAHEDVQEAWTTLMEQPDIQKSLDLSPEQEQQVSGLAQRATEARARVDEARETLDAKMAHKMEEALAKARVDVANGADPAFAERAAFESVRDDPYLRQLDEVVQAREAKAEEAEEALREAMPDKAGELVRAMNTMDADTLQVEFGLSEDTMEKVARYRSVAQRAIYDAIPEPETVSNAPAEALARARAAAQQSPDPAPAPVPAPTPASVPAPAPVPGGGGLATEALARARHMTQVQHTIVERTTVPNQGGMDERGLREAVRKGMQDGAQNQTAPAPPVRVQQAPPPPPAPKRNDPL